jgi:hypothetical protein
MTEPPTLRIVRGTPTPEELAVVTAVVAAASGAGGADDGGADAVAEPRRGRWNDPAAGHRRPWRTGPGAWRASLR